MPLYQHLKREKEVVDYVSATSFFLYTDSIQKEPPRRATLKEEVKSSDAAEHVTVCAHRVVPHEQLASESFVVEVVGELAHRLFEVVALLDDVPGEVRYFNSFNASSITLSLPKITLSVSSTTTSGIMPTPINSVPSASFSCLVHILPL